jgi:hypothetical protein
LSSFSHALKTKKEKEKEKEKEKKNSKGLCSYVGVIIVHRC